MAPTPFTWLCHVILLLVVATKGHATLPSTQVGEKLIFGSPAKVPPIIDAGNRAVVFKQDGSGFGNQVRGMAFVVLYSVLTQRRPVIDIPMYTRYFDFPAAGNKPLSLRSGPNLEACFTNPIACLRYTNQVVTHAKGVTYAPEMFKEQVIAKQVDHHFGTRNQAHVTYAIIRWLFTNPHPEFVQAVEHYKNQVLGLPKKFVIFQLRTFFDFAPLFDEQLITKNVDVLVEQFNSWFDEQPGRSTTTIYVTSDSHNGTNAVVNALAENSRIKQLLTAKTFAHTGNENHHNHISSAMVDWYLMGDNGVEAVFCSGTTFCISAAHRSKYPVTMYTHRTEKPWGGKWRWVDFPDTRVW